MMIQHCKGTRDLFPEEMVKFRLIEEAFRKSCLKWGYEEVRTPTLEYLHLFTSAGKLTPGMLNKVYSFLDWDGWSGERVVLRPDNTIPVARLYIDSMGEKELAKLFYVTNVFIFEETGKKKREKWQGGAELIGANSPLADVELIVLALGILKELGLNKVELKLSHAGLIRSLLMRLGLSSGEQAKMFGRILDGDEKALVRLKLGQPELDRALTSLIKMKGESSGFLKNFKTLFTQDLPELEPPFDNFINIVDLLKALGCDYQIDITSGRGFEYYTGIIFQLFVDGEKIGGGGRYDDLIPSMGGKDIPASGFALYLDHLMNLVKPETLAKPSLQTILVKTEPKTVKESFDIADDLRKAGYAVQFNLGGREPANLGWILDVRSDVPRFVLTNKAGRKKLEFQNAKEVLTLFKEKSVNKGSIT